MVPCLVRFTMRPFGSDSIESPIGPPNGPPPKIPDHETLPLQWVDWIWQRYGHLNALKLSDMTHEVGSPWQTEAEANGYRVANRHFIPDATTRAYFQRLATNLT